MTDRDKIIETMARATCDAEAHGAVGARSCVQLGALCRRGAIGAKCDAFKIASAALTAYESHLQASGMAVVPMEPTPEMIRAAEDADPSIGFDGCPFDVSWRAMLSAFTPVAQEDTDHG